MSLNPLIRFYCLHYTFIVVEAKMVLFIFVLSLVQMRSSTCILQTKRPPSPNQNITLSHPKNRKNLYEVGITLFCYLQLITDRHIENLSCVACLDCPKIAKLCYPYFTQVYNNPLRQLHGLSTKEDRKKNTPKSN